MDYKPERAIPIGAVWDIECADWDTFVCGAIWTPDDGVCVYDDEDELAEHLLSLPAGTVAWAHAGGRYDVLWLLDWCRRRAQVPKAQIHLSGSSVASLAIAKGPVLRDSARLMPMSLKEACKMFQGTAQKERLGFPCVCGNECGGYCSIRLKMPRAQRLQLRGYLEADILSLRDTLFALTAYAEQSGLLLAGTVASTGWRTAKYLCDLPDADWDLEAYKLARAGYYGGRVEVGQTRAARVDRFDRKQAYPAALLRAIPCGPRRMLTRGASGKAYRAGRPGIYTVKVKIPDQMAGPLPCRISERIVYPWGEVVGVWSRDELRHAEECGTKILGVFDAVVWKDEKPLIAPFVNKAFELREVAAREKNDALKTWLKFVANSPTGAFAQDPQQDVVALGDYADDPRYEPVGRYDWIWRRPIFRISQRSHVHWAATLTADARVELHRQIAHAGDDWVYSDTDSCHSLRKLTRNVGTGLGEWAFEGEGKDWRCLAPKVYSYEVGGKLHARAKGIPAAEKAWPSILAGSPVVLDRGVDSLLVAARGETLFSRRAGRRTIKPREGWVGARILEGVRTRAPHVTELASLPR